MRITNNMISQRVLANLQRNFGAVARLQDVLSTGRQFSLPEQNPLAYVESLNLRQEINENRRFSRNITLGTTNLQLTESTLGQVNESLQRARSLALQAANATLPAESRIGIAQEIEQILQDIVTQANASFEGRFLFAGDRTQRTPFELIGHSSLGQAVHYRGDFGDRLLEISQDEFVLVNLTGPQAFFTSLNEITSSISVVPGALLEPQLTGVVDPPLTLVAGDFTVNGVSITFDPATDTLENLRDSINRQVTTADARIVNGRLILRSLTSVDVELANGTSNVLQVLDLFHRVEGGDIGAGITGATTLASLGITGDAIRISIGEDSFDIDLAAAVTVGDVLAAVSASGAPVEAFINGSGTGITFSATRSVDSLAVSSIRRIFGTTALPPGTVTNDTTLASLAITTGVISITNDGATTLVDLSAATTVEQVIAAINSQVNGVNAALNADGTGIDLISQFFNGGLSASDVGGSTIAATLGFAQTRSSDNASDFAVTAPGEVDEVESENIFLTFALLLRELRNATPDVGAVNEILNRFDTDLTHISNNRSVVGSRVNRLDSAGDRYDAFEVFLTQLLSVNEDADLAETVTQLTTQSNILQASLAAGARLIQPSLLDFLR